MARKLEKKPHIIVNCYDSGNSIPQQLLFFEDWATGLVFTVHCTAMKNFVSMAFISFLQFDHWHVTAHGIHFVFILELQSKP